VQAWASGVIANYGLIIYDNQVAWPQISLIRSFELYAAQLYVACDAPIIQYDLGISSTAGGFVATPGEGIYTYDEGTVVDLVALAQDDYHFTNWAGNVDTIGDVNAASTTITMDADYFITATFAGQPDTYYLTVASTVGGHVTGRGEGTFACVPGAVLRLEAEPEEGYRFVEWTGDVGTIADVNDAATFITMMNDYSVTANFERVRDTYYDLTVASTVGGHVTGRGEGTFACVPGAVLRLEAEPEEGYRFAEWTGDVSTIAHVSAAQAVITMADHYAITAKFIKQYNLSINSVKGGRVLNPGEGTFTYDEGEAVELSTTRDADYLFVNWTGDVGTIADVEGAYTRIYMMGDYSITANFKVSARVNWPLIGGIMGVVVAVGLGIFFVRRKRVASAKGG
jgi:hypothetical protein